MFIKKKVTSFLLAGLTVFTFCYNYLSLMTMQTQVAIPAIKPPYIEKISENSVKISYPSDSIIFNKNREDSQFCYLMTDAASGENLGSFSSKSEINLNCDHAFSNPNLCTSAGLIWDFISLGETNTQAVKAAVKSDTPADIIVNIVQLTEKIRKQSDGGVHGFLILVGILTASQCILPFLNNDVW
jgi:hypothetical protein